MYQAWPWAGAAAANPAAGYVQSAVPTQVPTAQWPAGYGQYAVTPEMQQQWAAAWASQAQYAYTAAPAGDTQTPNAVAGTYPGFQTVASATAEAKVAEAKADSIPATEALKSSTEQNASESDKIKQLKEQAEKWTSLQQPAVTQWSYSAAPAVASTVSTDAAASAAASQVAQVTAEEEEFEKQFKEWEKQFEAWKEQNQNHPDKEAFAQYEKQWQEWREQLLQKKEQMQKAKAQLAAASATISASAVVASAAPSLVTSMPSSTTMAASAQYYQAAAAQYMYMQPYMYPGGAGVVPQVGMMPAAGMAPQMGYQMAPSQGMPGEGDPMQPPDAMHYDDQGGPGYEDMYGYGPGDRNGSMGPRYDDYEGPHMGMREDEFPRDGWGYGRGGPRGRGGRGRGRGRGGFDRWSEGPDPYGSRKTLIPGGPPAPPGTGGAPEGIPGGSAEEGDKVKSPPPFEYPTEDCRDQFEQNGPKSGQNAENSEDLYYEESYPYDESYPPGDRFMPGPDGYPPEEGYPSRGRFHGRFHPEDGRFPPGRGRFPPRYGPRGFEQFPPPEEEMFGNPPFRDDFPPFDERGPRGRGRFGGRGGRGRFGRDYDRFGPQFDYPPDDRFYDGPPRGPRGMRPYGPDDRPYFDERSSRFNTTDYSHRHRDDFDPHYDYEGEFSDDVRDFRDNFNANSNVALQCEPKIFSHMGVESFDYGHGMHPLKKTTIPAKEFPLEKFCQSPPKEFVPQFGGGPISQIREPILPSRITDYPDPSDFPEADDRFSDRDFRSREPEFRGKEADERFQEKFHERDRKRDWNDDFRDRESFDGDRNKEFKRDRDWVRDSKRIEPDKRFKWTRNQDNDTDVHSDKNRPMFGKKEISDKTDSFKSPSNPFKNESSEVVLIEDLLFEPKRSSRPKQLVIILRGLPGSGKTHFAKLIKDKEIENGGSPRILSLDDYFMVETEVTETDPDSGKRIKKKEFKFEYELEMEEAYRSSLFKSFKKTIDDRFFPFIIVDAVNEKTSQYEQYWSYAKQKGFQVYIAEMDCTDPVICHKRNVHNRSLEEITKILKCWERKPRHYISVDVRSLLQDASITEVEMEVENGDKPENPEVSLDEDDIQEDNLFPGHEPSKWEKLEATEEKLDQLDGLRIASKKKHSSMEDYLQLPDDYEERQCEPGKKRVRWADIEQRKEQDRMRAIGFVVGQTDWSKMTDPTHADKALTKTKYF